MLIHSPQSWLPMFLSHGLMEPVGYTVHWNECGTRAEPTPNSLHFDNKPQRWKHAPHPSTAALLLNGRSYRRGKASSPPPHSTTVSPTSPYFFSRFIAQPCIIPHSPRPFNAHRNLTTLEAAQTTASYIKLKLNLCWKRNCKVSSSHECAVTVNQLPRMAELRTAHTVSLCTGSSCHPTGLLHGFEYASRLKASCGKKYINLANHRWDLRFSQQWKIGLWSSRLWHCALSQVVSNLSNEPAAATFRAEVSQTGCEYMTYRITNGKRKHMRS